MPCECHKQALIDAAAANEGPPRELAAHLNVCPACRTAFAAEQQLFAVIDAGVHSAANTEAPVSLLPGVRARLDKLRVQRPLWVKPAVVFAAVALVLAAGVFDRGQRRESRDLGPATSTAAGHSAPPEVAAPLALAAGPERRSGRRVPRHNGQHRVQEAVGAAGVAVLVPVGQKAALDAFLAGLRNGTVKPDRMLAEESAEPATDEVPPLGIPEMQIKPLGAVSKE